MGLRMHGTNSMYIGGCRCFACRVAHANAERDRYTRRAAGVTERKKHVITAIRSVDNARAERMLSTSNRGPDVLYTMQPGMGRKRPRAAEMPDRQNLQLMLNGTEPN